jgi:predicted dehydrogenase
VYAQGVGAFTEDFKRAGVHRGVRTAKSKMWPDKGYAAQMSDFVENIRNGRAPSVTVHDGARATLGCLAMMESAASGEAVALNAV